MKREEWANKMDDMADKSKGMYLFYQFFMFISGLSLFLAICCVAILVYLVVSISRDTSDGEADKLINEGGQREKGFTHSGTL